MNSQSRRSHSRVYYIPKGSESVRVCKTAFLSIFGISSGRLDRALNAQANAGGLPHIDQWGRHVPANETSPERLALIREHINSFPRYKSHYSRKDNPNHQYLTPSLSLSKMYRLYKDWCTEKDEQYLSEWVYRKIFNSEYNLSFGR